MEELDKRKRLAILAAIAFYLYTKAPRRVARRRVKRGKPENYWRLASRLDIARAARSILYEEIRMKQGRPSSRMKIVLL